jgi:hypothetical protein
MNRNPLEELANRIGMYAYLAAVGGLRYWPTVRQAVIEEETYSISPAPRSDERAGPAPQRDEEKVSA